MKKLTLEKAFDNFILEKRVSGLASSSISDYNFMLKGFLRSLGSCEVDSLSYEMIAEYILDLQKKPLKKATVASYVRNIRIFLCWIDRELASLSFNPKKIKIPKVYKKKVHIYSDSDLAIIFDSIQNPVSWIEDRNRAIVAFMLDSGIRQCELCGLLWKNINRSTMTIKVVGKGSKERMVRIGHFTLQCLDQYSASCIYKDLPYVFVDIHGKQLSGNAVRLFTYKLQKELPFEFSSHKLRHNFATNFCLDKLHQTGNSGVYDLSILMGHESIETTRQYEHFAHELVALEGCTSHIDNVFLKK